MTTKSQQKPTTPPVIEMAFNLDQSGSMVGHQAAAIAGFNDFLFLAANQDAIATAAQMNISREHSATADGDNFYCSRDSSRKISSLREAAHCGTISADLEKSMEQILREKGRGRDTPIN